MQMQDYGWNEIYCRCEQKHRWIYLIGALPSVIYTVLAYAMLQRFDPMGLFFLTPAIVCLIHFFYPNLTTWLIVTFTYGILAALFLCLTVIGIAIIFNTPEEVDIEGILGAFVLLLFFASVAVSLIIWRPKLPPLEYR